MCTDFQEFKLAGMELPVLHRERDRARVERDTAIESSVKWASESAAFKLKISVLDGELEAKNSQITSLIGQVTVLSTSVNTLKELGTKLELEKKDWHSKHGHFTRKIMDLEVQLQKAGLMQAPSGTRQKRARSCTRAGASVQPCGDCEASAKHIQRLNEQLTAARRRATMWNDQCRYHKKKATKMLSASKVSCADGNMIQTRTHAGSRAPCTAENLLHTVEVIHVNPSYTACTPAPTLPTAHMYDIIDM